MPTPAARRAVDTIAAAARQLMTIRTRPIVVALDGRGGSGKSTVAELLVRELDAALVQGDDFYAAWISDAEWDARSAEERMAGANDWRRLREEAIEPLLAGRPAKWHPFDFAGVRADGTCPMSADFVEREPAAVIVLDGIYSSRPELADLIDLSVLVDAPLEVRHARLERREEPGWLASWHARWDCAEEYYLMYVRPPSSFYLIVTT